jgi:DNA-binding NtrC family response regulator
MLPRLLGQSSVMAAVRRQVEDTAAREGSVLILGETGTGRGLVARRIHAASRGAAPFVTLLCPALAREPTDFDRLFSEARGGSVLLDEVADMPLEDQDRFVGSWSTHAGAVRCLATARVDLEGLAKQGRFRPALRDALATWQISLPPLRSRLDDLPELVAAFLRDAASRGVAGREPSLTPPALAALAAHAWPGNVLELENVLERVVVVTSGDVIDDGAIRAALDCGPPH